MGVPPQNRRSEEENQEATRQKVREREIERERERETERERAQRLGACRSQTKGRVACTCVKNMCACWDAGGCGKFCCVLSSPCVVWSQICVQAVCL